MLSVWEGHDIEPWCGVGDGPCTALGDTVYIVASIDLHTCIRTVCQEGVNTFPYCNKNQSMAEML